MTFDSAERTTLAGLADILIPAGEGFPAASAAGVAAEGLDEVLAFRPDLAAGLKKLLAAAEGLSAAEFVAELQARHPAGFGLLAELVPGAYFINAQVRAQLGYHGQSARSIDPHPDYLDDGLLQSVINRGAVYRPTPASRSAAVSERPAAATARSKGKMNSRSDSWNIQNPAAGAAHTAALPRYDWHQSYDWNYEHAPAALLQDEPVVPGRWDYCGLPVASPLGIAAGPLLNGRWILYYAALGFDVLTYKTVRSRPRACYPTPNLLPVTAPHVRGGEVALPSSTEMQGSWAVSFGMPSKHPDVWRADVEATRLALPRNKILSVSVVATPEEHWTIDNLADDFARCAKWAIESGADCVEANFSCPNVASADGQLYQQPAAAGLIAARLRQAVESRPLLIKVGHLTDAALAFALSKALAPHVNALVMVNCIGAKVVDAQQGPLFDGQRRGIAGEAIREAAVDQVSLFASVLRQDSSTLRMVGVGGIATAKHVRAQLQAGSHAVQLATAAMLEPAIGRRIREELAAELSAAKS